MNEIIENKTLTKTLLTVDTIVKNKTEYKDIINEYHKQGFDLKKIKKVVNLAITYEKVIGDIRRFKNFTDLEINLQNLVENKIEYIFRKNPILIEQFKKYKKQGENIEKIKNVYNTYKSFRKIAGNISEFETLEQLDDHLLMVSNNNKVFKCLKCLPSNVRTFDKSLYNLIRNNISHVDTISRFYSRKGGRFKSLEELYKATEEKIISLQGEWNVESILEKAENCNVKIAFESNDLLVLDIKDYNASKILGTPDWCISTSESTFSNYIENNFNKQYFIYDFTKKSNDTLSIIGITVKYDNTIKACHDRIDSTVDYNVYEQFLKYCKPLSSKEKYELVDKNDLVNILKYDLIKYYKYHFDKIDINEIPKKYFITVAVMENAINIIKYLIKRGVDINYVDDFGDTPLLEAIKSGNLKIVKYLVENNADTTVLDILDRSIYDIIKLCDTNRSEYKEIEKYLNTLKQ